MHTICTIYKHILYITYRRAHAIYVLCVFMYVRIAYKQNKIQKKIKQFYLRTHLNENVKYEIQI